MSPMSPSPPVEQLGTAVRSSPLPDDADTDKHHRGTVLVIGGSAVTPGAVLLAGVAALRVGAGRLQIVTEPTTALHAAVSIPEALVAGHDDPELERLLGEADSVVVGPGLRDDATATAMVAVCLAHVPPAVPIVVDALALYAWADQAPCDRDHVVLTPNRQELAALAADDGPESDRAVAARLGATVVSFGRVALADGRVFVDDQRVWGLGTSGSGDVLAGAIGGIAARCGNGRQAAAWGAFVHRAAAERVSGQIAPSGYLARELADALAPALWAVAST